MPEEMGAFFDARLAGYEEHQLTCIAGAEEFYPFTAVCLPRGGRILDLGCGTGLELLRLKARQGIDDAAFYHYDTPLTVANEIRALSDGGFSKIEILRAWGAAHTLRAYK